MDGQLYTYDSKMTPESFTTDWFDWRCGGAEITATYNDADGAEVSEPVTGGTSIYRVASFNLMDGQCANSIQFVPDTSSSMVTIKNSEEV